MAVEVRRVFRAVSGLGPQLIVADSDNVLESFTNLADPISRSLLPPLSSRFDASFTIHDDIADYICRYSTT
ncbi:hypothetical protein NMY22_g4566 [Coprinellus aureogranulatus]|nr:hypothetical protein NMY22_g4566 [Coprinellus aureogranulatus]